MTIRVLTVHQPYAWAIMQPGGKNIENRSAAWKFRGALAIHAGLQWSPRGFVEISTILDYDLLLSGPASRRGAILGVVDLVDAHREQDGCCAPWGLPDSVHLVLENPRPLPEPIPSRGQLGLWTPPGPALAALQGFMGGAE